jgi:ubiquinone/menaquinone biosynthesis C-methylase UbiE
MVDYAEIYQNHAVEYEQLVAREDYEGNLPAMLRRIRSHEGLDVVDLGTGTGRLACMLAPKARSMKAYDTSQAMLDVATAKLQQSGLSNWETGLADHRSLPLPDHCADLVVSGWSVVYTVVWEAEKWQVELEKALTEMKRILRPGGALVIFETMGTGESVPNPPHDLLDYFDTLNKKPGFNSTWIRTDYRFDSQEEAKNLAGFFFGEEMIAKIVSGDKPILPECTGVWWLEK